MRAAALLLARSHGAVLVERPTFRGVLDVFGGHQSARTLHFFGFVVLLVFIVGHIAMAVRAGFGRQMRAMIVGR